MVFSYQPCWLVSDLGDGAGLGVRSNRVAGAWSRIVGLLFFFCAQDFDFGPGQRKYDGRD